MRSKAVLFVFCFWPMLNFINQNKEQLGQGDYVVLGSFFALTLVVAFGATLVVVVPAAVAVGWAVEPRVDVGAGAAPSSPPHAPSSAVRMNTVSMLDNRRMGRMSF